MKITPKQFEFVGYKFEPRKKKITFDYKIEFKNRKPLSFRETIVLPRLPKTDKVPGELLDNLLQSVNLILGISYFKLYCPPKIKLNSKLSEEQAEFWNTIYKKGLGEFLYRNKLDPGSLAKFPFDKNVKTASWSLPQGNKSLVGIGGGKDSIVTAELLKAKKIKFSGFVVETQKPVVIIDDVAKVMGIKILKVRRFLDEKIFLKYEDSYNGHIPISVIFAFLGQLSAVLYGYDNVIVSNEYSSNFGNLEYKGLMINHQWSKSAEFEQMLGEYSRKYLTPSVTYFSALRPYYEISIVEKFVQYKQYFSHFSSCNMSYRVNESRPETLWCGECPKCAFIFAMLAAFLPRHEVLAIFGKNLFDNPSLLSTYQDLLGFGEMKPFECVGTFEEVKAALYLARKKFRNELAIRTFLPKIDNGRELVRQVRRRNPAPTIPPSYRFLGAKNVLILGYGREGKVTHRFLKKFYPELKVGIADKKFNANYLEKQQDFDLAVKTPGMPSRLVTIPYTTATNLFFDHIQKRNNIVIGVTGSKGKSTTTSLVHAILKEAGLNVTLLGNIGVPMLGSLLKPVPKDRIYVLELSSYQLSDLWFSPNIAVVTNLFPEHMDYHGGENAYYEAKRNIINFQSNKDYFVFNPKNDLSTKWAKRARSRIIPFDTNLPLPNEEIPLLGKHNLENVTAAVAVARIFDISDSKIAQAITSFEPLRHRLQLVGEFKHIKFYDDAISTTPESTIAALESIPNVSTIFLGGTDRGYDFSELEKVLRNHKIKNVVLFPESGKRILKSRSNYNVFETESMEEAVNFAYANTPNGSVCLLSCASPSYTLWKDFEEKGDEFQKWVKKLGA